MNIVTQLFALLTELLTGFLGLITSVFKGVVDIFWVPGVGDEPGQFTIYGVFLLIGFVVSMIFLAINFIRGLIKNRG